ncbi:hypothetical protein [Candidatus Phytoplasma prunorum]|uniref:hypothetical protein n=1 Tax=Candidatus Phytoplasma prunorum TaxID=47565 RepID=UPI002FEEB837
MFKKHNEKITRRNITVIVIEMDKTEIKISVLERHREMYKRMLTNTNETRGFLQRDYDN